MYTTTLEDVKEKDNVELKDRLCETYMELGEVGSTKISLLDVVWGIKLVGLGDQVSGFRGSS